jgi:hypothetical protein
MVYVYKKLFEIVFYKIKRRNKMIKKSLIFISIFTISHIITYYIVGALAYALITNQFYSGETPSFIFMRTESNPELWSHVMLWMLPGQILRGILMSLPLLLIIDPIMSFSKIKRALFVSFLYFIFSHLSAAGPTTSNIEGFIYFKPVYFTASIFFLTQPEIILQSLGLGFIFSIIISIKKIKHNFI